jgi:hypothetical protein
MHELGKLSTKGGRVGIWTRHLLTNHNSSEKTRSNNPFGAMERNRQKPSQRSLKKFCRELSGDIG